MRYGFTPLSSDKPLVIDKLTLEFDHEIIEFKLISACNLFCRKFRSQKYFQKI